MAESALYIHRLGLESAITAAVSYSIFLRPSTLPTSKVEA